MKIVNVMASSLDGRIGAKAIEGDKERHDVGITCDADQVMLRREIESSDAIIVGASSIRANGDCIDHVGIGGLPPTWYILAKQDIDPNFAFWKQTHIRRCILSPQPTKIVPGSGVENLVFGEEDPAKFTVDTLRARGHLNTLLFGGGIINSWFYERSLVDELHLTIAPRFLGKPDAPFLVSPELSRMVKFSLLASHIEESFVFLNYRVMKEAE